MDDLISSTLAMFSKRKTCDNCWFNREGRCGLYTSDCATAVFNREQLPPRWISYEEGEAAEAWVLGRKLRK